MSRVGKSPIPVPSGVDVTLGTGRISVKGPQGTLERTLPGEITIRQEDSTLIVERTVTLPRLNVGKPAPSAP